jgi:hypothetical protein
MGFVIHGVTKAHSRLDSLIDVIGVGISFSASFKDSPLRPSLKHLNDGGSSDTAGSLTSELAGASDIWKRAVVDPN